MKADKLMFEVDHGARRAYEERAAKSEPALDEAPRAGARPARRRLSSAGAEPSLLRGRRSSQRS